MEEDFIELHRKEEFPEGDGDTFLDGNDPEGLDIEDLDFD